MIVENHKISSSSKKKKREIGKKKIFFYTYLRNQLGNDDNEGGNSEIEILKIQ
jgi:hypothetical protein